MGRPEPEDDLQRMLLKLVYERFLDGAKWAAFIPLDREFHKKSAGQDILHVAQSMPNGLLRPQVRFANQPPSDPFQLTLAGVVAATKSGGPPWDASVFLGAVRLATEIEAGWEGSDGDPDALPALTADGVVDRLWDKLLLNQLPDILSDPLIKRAGYLLYGEPMGWRSAHRLGESHWVLTIDREIRHYAGLESLDDYWKIRDRRNFENERSQIGWLSPSDGQAELLAVAALEDELLPIMLEVSSRFAGQIHMDQVTTELAEAGGSSPPARLLAKVVLSNRNRRRPAIAATKRAAKRCVCDRDLHGRIFWPADLFDGTRRSVGAR